MKLSFIQKLAQGDLLIGTIITLPSPEISRDFLSIGI